MREESTLVQYADDLALFVLNIECVLNLIFFNSLINMFRLEG